MKKKKTARGFEFYEFKDSNGVDCSLQKSSSAMQDKIWLGADKIGLKEFVPDGKTGWTELTEFDGENYVANNRMHLTRKQVKQMLPILQKFVETGDI